TKNYVPKLIAAAIIAKSPRRFGFTEVEWLPPFEFEPCEVEGGTDLRTVATALEMDPETLLEMNPALKYGIAPPGQKTEIRVPKGRKTELAKKLAELEPKKKYTYKLHQARRGETINWIAQYYGSTTDLIRDVNRLGSDIKLRRGAELLIPCVPG